MTHLSLDLVSNSKSVCKPLAYFHLSARNFRFSGSDNSFEALGPVGPTAQSLELASTPPFESVTVFRIAVLPGCAEVVEDALVDAEAIPCSKPNRFTRCYFFNSYSDVTLVCDASSVNRSSRILRF